MTLSNYYEILDVERGASAEEIKKAYRRMARKNHPDRKGGDTRAMVAINKSYDTLSDPKKREYYDATGEDPKRDTVEAQALQTIYQILMTLSEQQDDCDFVESVVLNLRNNRDTVKGKEPQLRRQIKKAEKQRKRIRHKHGKENLLVRVFDQKIAALNAALAGLPDALKVCDKALEILKDYESPFEAGAAQFSNTDPVAALLMSMKGTQRW